MAIYHFTASKGQKGKHSAKAKHAYISRAGKYARDDIVASGSGNMPGWVIEDAAGYWQAADEFERVNGRIFRAYEFSLPVELDRATREELAREFCQELADAPEGKLPYSFAIHEDRAGRNPHCHLIISERVNDGLIRTPETWFKRANKKSPEKGGAVKADSLEKKERLFEIRKLWADRTNQCLEKNGILEKIDHRSLVDQGIDRPPQLHIGPHILEMEDKGIITEKGTKVNERYREIERSKEIARAGRTNRAVSSEHGSIGRRLEGEYEKIRRYNKQYKDNERRNNSTNAKNIEATKDIQIEILSDSGIGSINNFDSCTERIINLAEPLKYRRDEDRDTRIEVSDSTNVGIEKTSGTVEKYGKELEITGSGKQEVSRTIGNEENNGERFTKADRTTEAVKNQIRAMGCSCFEVGIRNDNGMINKEFTPDEVIKAIPWLKRMNAQGNDIYIRPAANEQSALVLLDDLDPFTVEEMREQGLAPALVVETSHKNCQAWVKLCPERLSDALRSDISKKLAQELGADPASAEKRHYGRLAGFTNRKEKHFTKRGFPYALCRSSTGQIAERGQEIVAQAIQRQNEERERLEAQRQELEAYRKAQKRIEAIENAEMKHFVRPAPEQAFKKYMREWLEHQQEKPDWSKGDYAVACRMAKEQYRLEDIAKAIAEHSPSIDTRKLAHSQEYAERTATAACNDKLVLEAIRVKEQEKQKARERSKSRRLDWSR